MPQSKESSEEPLRPLWLLFGAILLVQVAFGFVLWNILPDANDRGLFGDMFGAAGALFSGLAFGGLIYALLLQRRELILQRKELRLTRQELRSQAQSLADQASTSLRAAKISGMGALLQANTQLMADLRGRSGGHEASLRVQQLQQELDALLEDAPNYMPNRCYQENNC